MNADPLAGLRDWHSPEAISWWPPAPGWWLLLVVVLILVWTIARWLVRQRRRSAVVRLARRELEALRSAFADHQDGRRYVAELSRLLRRLALVRYSRERVAGLSGRAWLEFLDATGGQGGFVQGAGRLLVEDAYRPVEQAPGHQHLDELGRLAARWVDANGGARA
ncbi:DUF4381 domain-containing protein [Thiocystis violacea]|uniref:DUF4381 domain-containing protein n=1 Tax=Thiocystis violacea TaxID=13725 RepID=UPI0019086728|nr:DUF4381 domain-containing protein [Thiocystis violacea]MBK1722004.1 hypothetical protein [Thiocystis violacea]